MKREGQVSIKERIGYAMGDVASNFFFQSFMLFLMYFYTDIVGISAGVVGTMMLITRIWDAVNDPMMGAIADRTNTRWGKFRPYLLWFAVPFGVVGVLTFATPNWSMTGKIVYAYTTYTLMMMIYTAINVPYSALMGVLTPNPSERTVISSYRFVGAFIGGLVVQATVPSIVAKYYADNEALGYRVVMTGVSALAVILFLITFFTTKERVSPPKEQKSALKQDLRDLIRNKPWLLIAGATVMQLTLNAMRNGAIMYYFKYFVGKDNLILFGKEVSYSMTSAFMMFGTVFTIIGAMLAKPITAVLQKGRAYTVLMLLTAVFVGSFFFFSPEQVELMFLFQLLASLCMGPMAVLQWSIYTDTADYGEWKFGRRATGLIMAASLFALKLGLALGGALLGWILQAFGFVPNVAQTVTSLVGIRAVMSLFPALAAVLGAAFMFAYPLTQSKLEEIEAELTARRQRE